MKANKEKPQTINTMTITQKLSLALAIAFVFWAHHYRKAQVAESFKPFQNGPREGSPAEVREAIKRYDEYHLHHQQMLSHKAKVEEALRRKARSNNLEINEIKTKQFERKSAGGNSLHVVSESKKLK